MHGHTLVDAHNRPLRNAILWSDGRAAATEAQYAALTADQRRRLGNPFITGSAGATLPWLAAHEPDVLRAARWSLLPKDMLRTFLVDGPPVTDPSDASANLLWDVLADAWAARHHRRAGRGSGAHAAGPAVRHDRRRADPGGGRGAGVARTGSRWPSARPMRRRRSWGRGWSRPGGCS